MKNKKAILMLVVLMSFFVAFNVMAVSFPTGEKDDNFDTTACTKNEDYCSNADGDLGRCYNKGGEEWGCYIPEEDSDNANPQDTVPPKANPQDTVPPKSAATAEVRIPTSAETGLSDLSIRAVLSNLLTWLLGIVGVIALIGFVISGIQYIVSTGDEKIMESAKRNMIYSTLGIVVVLASLVIVQAIDFALRGYGTF